MKIGLCTIYTKNIMDLAAITVECNKRMYCDRHEYKFFKKTGDFSVKDIGFEKLVFVRDTLLNNDLDWIYWCGADTLITNYTIKLEDLIHTNYNLIVTCDIWDWNLDSFLIKNDSKSIDFLNKIISKYDQYINDQGKPRLQNAYQKDGCQIGWAEQAAIIEECKLEFFKPDIKPEYIDFVKEVPQKTMNSYLYFWYPSHFHQKGLDYRNRNGQWSEGDFLVHWAGMPNETRISYALKMIKSVKE